MTPTSLRSFYRQSSPSIRARRGIHFSNGGATFFQTAERNSNISLRLFDARIKEFFVPCGIIFSAAA
jgi:hypothetical protein